MVNFTIYAGGYSPFIVSCLFDTQTASLTYLDTIATSPNPSWLAPHPTNANIIYATNENAVGALQSYATSPGGGLTLLDEVSSGGNGPAFCWPLTTRQYGSGNGEIIPKIIPTTPDGAKFDDSTSVLLTFPPPSGGGQEVFVPDLGGDKIWRIGQTGAPGHFSIHGLIPHPQGSGPRHMAVLNDSIYVLHETADLLIKEDVPSYPNGTFTLLASVTTLPDDLPGDSKYAAAELIIPPASPAFPDAYIYASNRNIGTVPDARGDSIAIFEPGLALVNQVFTGPRRACVVIGDQGGLDRYQLPRGNESTRGLFNGLSVDAIANQPHTISQP
ncbi:putative isomerase YbhE [Mycena polygramma]|nr:putative isomerase YbhE [Mycena polygramma]